MDNPQIDVSILINLLGADGARAGLKSSRKLSVANLRDLAAYYGIHIPAKATRSKIVDALILRFDRRINKPVAEMRSMNAQDLLKYLEESECSAPELEMLLQSEGIPFRKNQSRAALIRLAADRIANIGMYLRIAGHEGVDDTPKDSSQGVSHASVRKPRTRKANDTRGQSKRTQPPKVERGKKN